MSAPTPARDNDEYPEHDDVHVEGDNTEVGTSGGETKAPAAEESKEAKMSVRLLVGSKDAGGLIGKGGAIVKKLREDTGAVIDIADPVPRALKRIVTVKGTLSSVLKALSQISDKLAERRRGARKTGRTPEDDIGMDEGDDSKNSLTLLIANAQVGCVIGKGGEQIRATRVNSGANVKVSEKMLEGSTEKSVLIEGSTEQVAKACDLIAGQLLMTQDRAVAKVPYVPRPTFGIEGAGFPNIYAYDPQYTAAMAQLPMHMIQTFPVRGEMGGFAAQQAPRGLRAGHHQVAHPHAHAHSAPAGVPLNVGGGGGGVAEPSVLISVAESVVGSIIGRGGAVIKEIRQRSRAQIRIGDPSPTGGDRTITITGSRQCNEVAVALVYEKIAAAEGYRKMGGDPAAVAPTGANGGVGGRSRRERNNNGQQQAGAAPSNVQVPVTENKAADE